MSLCMNDIQTFLSPFLVSNVGANGKLDFPKTGNLLEHVIERKNVISLRAAVKFAKLAFTYEEWGLFESLAAQLVRFLQVTRVKVFMCFSILLTWR